MDDHLPSLPPIVDHRQMPAGVLPRHLQQWVLAGIAIVMIGILAMGGGAGKPKAKTSQSPAAAVPDPNQQRIEAYQRRIQEQAQRLTQEQTALARAKQLMTSPPQASTVQPVQPVAEGERPAGTSPTGSSAASAASTTVSLQQERMQREYRSLFADNVAFSADRSSGRGEAHSPAVSASTSAPAPAVRSEPATMPTPASPSSPVESGRVVSRPESSATPLREGLGPRERPGKSDATGTAGETGPPVPPAGGRALAASPGAATYRLTEGTIIETVLTNRLDGTFAGPVNCLVTTAVYAADEQHLVIPAGARVLGEARPVNTFGQSRLAVVFHRLLQPNGTRIDLHDFHGLNQIGDEGLQDEVNHHYAQIFGVSLAVGAIAGFAQAQSTVGVDATALDAYRQGAAANVSQSSARILDRFLNILPTVTIREGHRIKVYLSNDLELPVYRETLHPAGGRP